MNDSSMEGNGVTTGSSHFEGLFSTSIYPKTINGENTCILLNDKTNRVNRVWFDIITAIGLGMGMGISEGAMA